MGKLFNKEQTKLLTGVSVTLGLRQLGLLVVMPFLAIFGQTLTHSTSGLIGLSIGIFGLTQAFLQIPLGSLSDRVGRKPIVVIGMLIYSAGLFIAAFSESIYFLILARALQGGGAIAAVLFSWIGDKIPDENRNRAMAFPGIVVGLVSVFSFILGPLLYKVISVNEIFIYCGILSMFAVFFIQFGFKNEKPTTSSNFNIKNAIVQLKSRPFLSYVSAGFALNFSLTGIFFIIPLIVKDLGRIDDMWLVFVPATIIGILALRLASVFADKGFTKQIILIALFVLAVGSSFLMKANFNSLIVSAIIFLSGYMALTTVLPASVTKLSGAEIRGTITGVFNTSQFVGSFAGSTVTGILWGIDPKISVITLISLLVIAIVLVFFLSRKK